MWPHVHVPFVSHGCTLFPVVFPCLVWFGFRPAHKSSLFFSKTSGPLRQTLSEWKTQPYTQKGRVQSSVEIPEKSLVNLRALDVRFIFNLKWIMAVLIVDTIKGWMTGIGWTGQ